MLQAGLERLGGRCAINSVNYEDGDGPDSRFAKAMPLVREHGAAVVALTIDEEGQARTAEWKVAVADRLIADLTGNWGMRIGDIIVDCLTFPVTTGQEETRRDALETIKAIKQVTTKYPGIHTTLGISNVSFGLNPAARQVLNSVFLHECVEAGLDSGIVPAARIVPIARIPEEQRQVAEDLIYDRRSEGYDPLTRFLELFEGVTTTGTKEARAAELAALPLGERLQRRIVDGEPKGLEADLDEALTVKPGLEIINDDLLAGMKVVGELFGSGQMQLPFVLASAEVMKTAVRYLEPHLDKADAGGKGTMVIATVKGDVHDIGKNLVDIILTNNGYTVINLGIKQPVSAIIEAALAHNADAIGMSGLLVKSTVVMRDNLAELNQRGLTSVPGDPRRRGADPRLRRGGPQRPVRRRGPLRQGRLRGTLADAEGDGGQGGRARCCPARTPSTPGRRQGPHQKGTVPFRFSRRNARTSPAASTCRRRRSGAAASSRASKLAEVAAWLDERATFMGQWGLRSADGRAELRGTRRDRGTPAAAQLARPDPHRRPCMELAVVYGYWPCHSEGETLILGDPDDPAREVTRFTFPRQSRDRHLCLADFFRDADEAAELGPDVIGLQLVTMGSAVSRATAELFAADAYRDYLELHGLSVQLTEALAEYWHARVRSELGLDGDGDVDAMIRDQAYRGSRYSFGYPACPDLADRAKLVALLRPERIGVELSEELQLHPEQSTDAIVLHHPEAKYFNAR